MSEQTNRREFLQTAAAAGIGFWVAGGVGADEPKKVEAKLERLNFACIGVGGKGSSDADHVASLGDVVAICDVDSDTLEAKANQTGERRKGKGKAEKDKAEKDKNEKDKAEKAKAETARVDDKEPPKEGKFKKAARFADFREMLAKMGDKIDAVTVSTPDHTHAVAAMMAIKAGKHVYCQKPLTHSVAEARALREAARSNKVCTQMGNQGCALDNFRTSVELLRSGALGTVKEVHVWTNRPVWPQSPKITSRPKEEPVPKYLSWDLWLGPAPFRPFAHGPVDPKNKKRGHYHDFNWRGWWDFGTGALGDMACHTANMPYMGLELGLPTSIEAECEKLNEETYPGWAKITFEFPARGKRAALKLVWYEGKKDGKRVLPPAELFHGEKVSDSASLIVAENGILYSPDDYGQQRKMLGKDAKDVKPPQEKLFKRRGGNNDVEQKKEWVEAIKANDPKLALSNFDYAAMLTEAILLGNAAMRAGKKLEYDGERGQFTDSSANKLLGREYRTGWKL